MYNAYFYFCWHLRHRVSIIFVKHSNIEFSMQHASFTPSTYPGSCKTCFLFISVFGRKVSLVFLIIELQSDLWAHLHIHLSGLVNPLISADSCPGWPSYSLWGLLFHFHRQLALKSHWVMTYFDFSPLDTSNIINYISLYLLLLCPPLLYLILLNNYNTLWGPSYIRIVHYLFWR